MKSPTSPLLVLVAVAVAAANAAAVRDAPGSPRAMRTPAAALVPVPTYDVFAEPRLIAFREERCGGPPFPRDMLNSDKKMCKALRSGNARKLDDLIECEICYNGLHSDTLSTTACGHVSHQSCRYKSPSEACHACRGEGPHVDLNRNTIFRDALVTLEDIGYIRRASRGDLEEQDLLSPGGLIKKYFDYDFDEFARGIDEDVPKNYVPAAADRMPRELRRVFRLGKTVMDRCERNVVLRLEDEDEMRRLQGKMLAYAQLMNLDAGNNVPVHGRRSDLDLELNFPRDDVRAWMLRFSHTLNAALTRAVPTTHPEAMMTDRKVYVAWLSRFILYMNLVGEFPCDGHIPRVLVVQRLALLFADFLTTFDPTQEDDDMHRDLENIILAAEDTLPSPSSRFVANEAQLMKSLSSALTRGREVVGRIWQNDENDASACPVASSSSSELDDRSVRDGYVAHLRRSVSYFSLPDEDLRAVSATLEDIDTATCDSTAHGLRSFGDALSRALNAVSAAATTIEGPIASHVLDWIQRLDGLKHFLSVPHFSSSRLSVARATSLFSREVDAATANLKSWINVASLIA